MNTPAISIQHFSKSFHGKNIINDLSFEVSHGDIFAFLGANGSGKTTTIRSLLGIYSPDQGELLIDGKKYSPKDSARVGYLPEERGLYLDSTPKDLLTYMGTLKKMSAHDAKVWVKTYLKRVELPDKFDTKIKKLSSGQQQKIQLGLALIGHPEILILDEPLKGLDPRNRELLLEILNEIHTKGKTILFSTHQMEEVEQIIQSLLILHNGKASISGNFKNIQQSYSKNTYLLETTSKVPQNPHLYTLKKTKNRMLLSLKTNPNETLSFLLESGVQIKSFTPEIPSLSDIFLHETSKI